jgi:hypothetical protein
VNELITSGRAPLSHDDCLTTLERRDPRARTPAGELPKLSSAR